MHDPVVNGMLRGGQRLAQYLATKHLRTTNIATFAAKNIVFDTLQLEQRNQVIENRMHTFRSLRVRRPQRYRCR